MKITWQEAFRDFIDRFLDDPKTLVFCTFKFELLVKVYDNGK